MKTGRSTTWEVPDQFQRNFVGHKNFVFFGLLQAFLDFGVFPVRSSIKYFEVDNLARFIHCMDFHARFVGHVGGKSYSLPEQYVGMDLQEDCVTNASLSSSHVFHGMVIAKAEVDVVIHFLKVIRIVAPLISTGCGYFYVSLLKLCQRIQSAVSSYQW